MQTKDYLGRRARVRHQGGVYYGDISGAEDVYDWYAGVWRVLLRVRANYPGHGGNERTFSSDAVEMED